MKNKIIAILILTSLFAPLISQSAIMFPTANLTIVVNTEGEDSSFNFELKECPTITCNSPTQISLQTQGLTGSILTSITAFVGERYYLNQENVSGLKIANIHCASDNLGNVFSYLPDGVSFSPKAWSNITCVFNNVKIESKKPVLIVPGLMGTEMKNNNETLWINPKMVNPFNDDSFMDTLQFFSDLNPSDNQVIPTDVIKSIKVNIGGIDVMVYNYIENLIQEFQNQGYVENQNLFTFPYDWRYGVSGEYSDGKTNVDLLSQKIQDIIQQTGSDKVDVIAHSLGGLIVKKYVMNNPANHKINKTIFVGVPNTGAPKAVKVLLQGDNFGVLGLNDSEMKKIAENLPVSYDLLPSQQYYDIKGSFIKVVDRGGPFNLFPTQKDLNYSESESFLTADHLLNSSALTGAENLHTQSFDNFDLRTTGVDVYAIDGCKAGTLGKIIEVRYKDIFGNNHITYDRPKLTPGDSTVPLESATNLPINQSNKYYAMTADHSKMMSQNGIRQQIVNLISGSALSVGSNLITQDISKCRLNGKAISVFSPVDIFVTDQAGNKLGLAEDKSVINEIPNADFEILGEHKFVYLPGDDGQTYSISLNGTDTGTFTIKSQDIQNNQEGTTEVFSNIPVSQNILGNMQIGSAGAVINLDTNGDGVLDKTIQPSSIINENQSEDFLPPVSKATLTGEIGKENFYRSDVKVSFEAIDEPLNDDFTASGVLDIEYNLDNQGYQKIAGTEGEIIISEEGEHTLTFFSADKAGNNEPEKTITFTIDKTAPEAIIQFDLIKKDLKFLSSESAEIQDKDDTIILTDQAGNITEIKLKNKNRKILMSAEIKSIKYNKVSADISKNKMAFFWLYDKKGNLKMLSQYVKSKKDYNILAVYDGKNTKITGRDFSGRISKIENGLKILKITTFNGDFSWSY